MNSFDLSQFHIAVVIPAYRVERHIRKVVAGIPAYIRHIIVVDDSSPDATPFILKEIACSEPRLKIIRNEQNSGVGAAVLNGFREAQNLGAQIIVKMDGDDQMSPDYLPDLIVPLVKGKADYAKGNRFRDFRTLNHMPILRRIGNLGLSFLTKAATGYWSIFDPTNGFFAIRTEVLGYLPFERISKRYFFETSLLANLYLIGTVVRDVPIPARYGDENSSLSIMRTLVEFPPRLLVTFFLRILLKHFVFDFSVFSIYLLTGLPLVLFGLLFGISRWIYYAGIGVPAPTGTVMLPTLSLILGIQFLLSAIQIDLASEPKQPLTDALPAIKQECDVLLLSGLMYGKDKDL